MAVTALPIERLDIAVAGGALAAYRLGPADAPPVLAVHGITANSHSYLAVARALAGRASLIAVDLRGRGASNGLPAPYGTAAYGEDLVAVIEQLGLAPALLVGHSLGAFVISRFAVEHPELVRELVLLDGGLAIPGSADVEPQQFITAFLGPALARLSLRFDAPSAYYAWWRAHPAIAGHDVADADLIAYADQDLTGSEPELRSAVIEQAVRADAAEIPTIGQWAQRLTVPARLLTAPRGLLDDPNPMQPAGLAQAWAQARPERSTRLVQDVNHYTLTLGSRGAHEVAEEIAAAVAR